MLKVFRTFQSFSLKRNFSLSVVMSHSKYEYVRKFETEDRLLPECWIVVRIDGKAFHKFSDKHNFVKPNDKPALDLVLLESYTLNKELMFLCCFLGSRIQLRIWRPTCAYLEIKLFSVKTYQQ